MYIEMVARVRAYMEVYVVYERALRARESADFWWGLLFGFPQQAPSASERDLCALCWEKWQGLPGCPPHDGPTRYDRRLRERILLLRAGVVDIAV